MKPFGAIRRRHQQRDASESGGFKLRVERLLPHRRIRDVAQAKVCKLTEAALDQMLGRQLAHQTVVEAHARHRRFGKRARDVDDRNLQLLDAGGFRRRVEGRDDSVAAPTAQVEHGERQRFRRRDVRPVAAMLDRVAQHAGDEHLLVCAAGKGQRNFFGSFHRSANNE